MVIMFLSFSRANLKRWQVDAEIEKQKEEQRAKQEKEQEQKETTRDGPGKTAEAVSA